MPSHYLNHWWFIVNWALRKTIQWNFNQNLNSFIKKIMHLKMLSGKWWPFCLGLSVLKLHSMGTSCHTSRGKFLFTLVIISLDTEVISVSSDSSWHDWLILIPFTSDKATADTLAYIFHIIVNVILFPRWLYTCSVSLHDIYLMFLKVGSTYLSVFTPQYFMDIGLS